MARFLFWIVMFPVAVAIILFATVNRQAIDIDLWPAPFAATLPVWALALGGTALGFVLGGFAVWSAAGKARADARGHRRKADSLSRDLMLEQEKVRKLETAVKEAKAGAAASAEPSAALPAPE